MMYNMCGCVMYVLKYLEYYMNVCDGLDKDVGRVIN